MPAAVHRLWHGKRVYAVKPVTPVQVHAEQRRGDLRVEQPRGHRPGTLKDHFNVLARRMDDPRRLKTLFPEGLHRIPGEWVDTINLIRSSNLQQAQVSEERFLTNEFRIDPEDGTGAEFGRDRIGFVDERECGH